MWWASAVLGLAMSCNAPPEQPAPSGKGGKAPVPDRPDEPEPDGDSERPDSDRAQAPPAASTYRAPSKDVVAIVDAPPTPVLDISPTHDRIALAHYDAHPSIDVVSRPFERLAGIRIDADRNARRTTRVYRSLGIMTIADKSEVTAKLPEGSALSRGSWSPDGSKLTVRRTTDEGVELWVVDAATGDASRLGDFHLNNVFFGGVVWVPGSDALLVRTMPEGHGPAPLRPTVPSGPVVMDTQGEKATNRTYQDLLQSPADEAIFEHLATAQLALVNLDGTVTPLGEPDLITTNDPSPDGKFVLTERLRKPFSYVVPAYRFARVVEVMDRRAKVVRVVADQDAADDVPIGGVRTGAREVAWVPTGGATLYWKEALDGGDPKQEAEFRDRLMTHAAPFADTPVERLRSPQRLQSVTWTEREGELLATEYDRDRRWVTTWWVRPEETGALGRDSGPKKLFDRSIRDAYADPGRPVYKELPSGHAVAIAAEGKLLLRGTGATPDGDRPFLTSYELATGATSQLFRAAGEEHAMVVGLAATDASRFIVRREGPDDPPDYFVEGPAGADRVQLTEMPHPHPQLSHIEKRVLKYERKDGVALSGTLYLPPGYEEGQVLPLVVWAYPIEFNDADTAGQVRAAPHAFTRLRSTSPLMFLTQGYAVLSGAAMPVIGDPETMNDTFIEQTVWAAEAAIDAAVKEGVADRERVGVGGHSYGAFMTANLLAHSDLFKAGLARSGAYNRSLTPFGFQSERRTLWEATDTYVRVSPLFAADKIDEPLLMVHGEVDANSGTYPLQSKRLFHAMKGTGGTAKLVLLPSESHGYSARESVLHVLAESFDWFDHHVKNAES